MSVHRTIGPLVLSVALHSNFVTPLQFFRLRYSLDVLLFVTLMEVILIVILSAGPFHFDTHC